MRPRHDGIGFGERVERVYKRHFEIAQIVGVQVVVKQHVIHMPQVYVSAQRAIIPEAKLEASLQMNWVVDGHPSQRKGVHFGPLGRPDLGPPEFTGIGRQKFNDQTVVFVRGIAPASTLIEKREVNVVFWGSTRQVDGNTGEGVCPPCVFRIE